MAELNYKTPMYETDGENTGLSLVEEAPLDYFDEPVHPPDKAVELQEELGQAVVQLSQAEAEDSAESPVHAAQSKKLPFKFKVDGKIFDESYSGSNFAEKDPTVKLLLAIGQASQFIQTDEHYDNYLHRMTNKGLPDKEVMPPKNIKKLLRKLVKDGYAQNGGPRFRLTPEALPLLAEDAQSARPQKTSSSPLPKKASNRNSKTVVAKESDLIKPAEFPRLPHKAKHGWLDMSQHALNQKIVNSVTYRQLEVLAELELTNEITPARNRTLPGEIRLRVGSNISGDNYKRPLERLQEKGLATINIEGKIKTLALTDKGSQLITLLKAYPEDLKVETKKRSHGGLSLDIIELVMRHTGITIDSKTTPEDLPEQTEWLFPKNRTDPIVPYLAQNLGVSEGALARRLYDIFHVKGYIDAEGLGTTTDGKAGSSMSNICVLKRGLEHALKSHVQLRVKDEVLDEIEVEDVQEMVESCMHLAEDLNDPELAEELRLRYDERHLFEFTAPEFNQEKAEVEALYQNLRQSYISKFKK